MGHMEQKLIKERKKGNAKLWKKEIVTLNSVQVHMLF